MDCEIGLLSVMVEYCGWSIDLLYDGLSFVKLWLICSAMGLLYVCDERESGGRNNKNIYVFWREKIIKVRKKESTVDVRE